jgi:cation diffusion facilitator CzcD-associated flavoprotein CzcO
VKDPEKARKLQPHDLYARRPLCDGGYYEQFNRDNVSIVDLKEEPITSITGDGIITTRGKLYTLDVIVFATGFDAIDGNYNRVRIHGVGGETLKDHWGKGPTSFLGVSVPNFPNMFMITGPQSPFCNIPTAIEVHVEFITETIKAAEAASQGGRRTAVEATAQAESEWNEICHKAVEGSLFKETASWIFGSNVPGKEWAVRFYFGGLRHFRSELQKVVDGDYRGFKPFSVP